MAFKSVHTQGQVILEELYHEEELPPFTICIVNENGFVVPVNNLPEFKNQNEAGNGGLVRGQCFVTDKGEILMKT
ncbi:hypothetical protein [Flexithrix dorotheae]|uniref:hypothetical protein n=1 Tax=Flexithrix dorotheae TaxID=70993 RepID=UPI000375EB7C|nr:hypothetical protein [Flexithrix dorotheae]